MPWPRSTDVEMYVNGNWVSLSDAVDVRDDPITITHGSSSESGIADPGECGFILDNPGRTYDPFNSLGPYYGSLGLNTPLRVATRLISDDFSRNVTAGWGDAVPGLLTYHRTGAGTVLDSDWNVNGSQGTVALMAAAESRSEWLQQVDGVDLVDVEQAATVSMDVDTVTGSGLFPLWLLSRVVLDGDGSFHYLAVVLSWATDGTVTVGVYRRDPNLVALLNQTPVGFSFAPGVGVRLAACSEGHTMHLKVWRPATENEPAEWQHSVDISMRHVSGGTALRHTANSGNTNTYPMTITVDDYVVRSPRHHGEIAELPQRRDDEEAYVPVVSAGPRRRLLTGRALGKSTLTDGYLSKDDNAADLAAYWPGEEGPNSVALGSGVGGPPMNVFGETTFAAYSEIPSTAPVPTVGTGASWRGTILNYTPVEKLTLRWVMKIVPGQTKFFPMIELHTSRGYNWEVKYEGDGDISVQIWNPYTGALIYDGGIWDFDLDDVGVLAQLTLESLNGDIFWEFSTLRLNADTSFNVDGIFLGGGSLGVATRVVVSRFGNQQGLSIGQIAVFKTLTNIFDMKDPFDADNGVTAGDRINDVFTDGGILFDWFGELSETQRVGYRRVKTSLELADEAARADGGSFGQARSWTSLVYQPLRTRYNRPVFLTLDYNAEELSAPFEPLRDDEGVTNDVTIKRIDGGAVFAELTTGAMSTKTPGLGGIGRYDSSSSLLLYDDLQLPHVANWQLHVGTVNERRYPSVTVDLGNLTTPKVMLALSLNVDDRIQIVGAPDSDGPIDLLVRGYTETIHPFGIHQIEFYCVPASPYDVLRPLTAGMARVSSSGSTLNAAITDSQTVFDVDTPTAPLWFDPSPGSYDLSVGGEVLTLTGVAAVSATRQTFTVTRSVNGVVKSHAAAAPIRLARRATVPL